MKSTVERLVQDALLQQQRESKYGARKRINRIALALSLAAMAFGVFWLVWILFETVRRNEGTRA